MNLLTQDPQPATPIVARRRKITTKDRVISMDGYVRVYMPGHPKEHGSFVKEHTIIAERAVGHPLPATVHVHHFDFDESNNANSNLVICQDSAYHMILHARQRIKAAGGNPDTQLMCLSCKAVKDDDGFCRHTDGRLYRRNRSSRCRECASILQTRYREQRRLYSLEYNKTRRVYR